MADHYKSVFISDVHLGISGIQIDKLTDWIKEVKFENLFMVGDIIDHWKLKRSWHWPQPNNKFVRTIMKKAKKANVYYLPGNHDDFLKEFDDLNFGDILIKNEIEYEALDGRKILVCHGDEFDSVVKKGVKLAKLGSVGYELLFWLNQKINAIRRFIGFKKHWSLSAYIKSKVKNAIKYINRFEDTLIDYAKHKKMDAVICGHIHQPIIKEIHGFTYMNCGDFVENLTVLVEHTDGRFEILDMKE